MVVPFLTVYASKSLHYSIIQSTLLLTCYGLGAILGGWWGGALSDKLGFRTVQLFALFSGGFLFFLLSFESEFFSVVASIILLSFCNEAFRPANSVAIAFYSRPGNNTKAFSLNRLATNLGWAMGGALGGWLASCNYKFLFWADGATNLLAGLLLLALLPRSGSKLVEVAPVTASAYKSPYRDNYYLVFIFLCILVASGLFQFFNMQALYFSSVWHLKESIIGGLMAVNGLTIAILEMILIHALDGKRDRLIYISFGVILLSTAFLLIYMVSPGWLNALAIVLLVTLGEMTCMPFMDSFWMTRTSAGNGGAYTGLYAMTWSSGQVLSPIFGGLMVSAFGFGALWNSLCVAAFLAATGFFALYRYRPSQVSL